MNSFFCQILYIKMYHFSSFEEEKNKVLLSLTSNTPVRLILSTSALGCGVDMKDVTFVVHFGPPFDTIDYCQQIGRAGRG